jgi:murein DD-endopeptidase MepM/ murein hydrolase activator NlpD
MGRRFYTFIIFPGAHGKLRRVRFPFYVVHLVLAFSAVGILTVAALASSYSRMLLKVSDYNSLTSEREAMKTRVRTLENAVSRTNAKLDSLESLATEVAFTYGFGQAHRLRLPIGVLALATQTNSTMESSYQASLYAFDLIRRCSLNPTADTVALGLFPSPELERDTVPSRWPVRGQITAGFGQRLDPFTGEGAFHSGVDISAPVGAAVDASADGIVLHAGPEFGYGNEIMLDHGFGITTKYGHLSKVFVVTGQDVKTGQVIGAVGMTGRATGPHLHYEVIVNDTPVNPVKYLQE